MFNRVDVETPLGRFGLIADEQAIVAAGFVGDSPELNRDVFETAQRAETSLLATARQQVEEYFAGQRVEFELPLAKRAQPGFQAQVEAELARIPYGQTRTYQQVAAALTNPGATRAVGSACGRNPLPVLVPCHRVVPASGKLGGYVGGEARKRALLTLEGALS